MAVPSHSQQETEARQRREAGIDPNERAEALDVIADLASGDGGEPAPRRTQSPDEPAPPPPPPKATNPNNERRNAIIARYRTDRTEQKDDEPDEISDFAHTGMPPEFAQTAPAAEAQPEPAPEPAPAPAPPAAKQTVRLKVRGQEMDLPLEEVIAKAQMTLAADNYLDEAKGKLNEVNALLHQTRTSATRPAPSSEHHAAPNGTQPAEPDLAGDSPQHPEDPIATLLEQIQYGADQTETRNLLKNTLSTMASTEVRAQLEADRLRDEGARAAKVLKDFEDQHPDLAKDKKARAAIEAEVYDLQLADLQELGIDPAKLPTSTPGVYTPADIAVAHRWYRAHGHSVRTPKQLLETATDNVIAWRGVKQDTTMAAPPTTRTTPRVEVNVDRTARRQAIPQQPARTTAPQATSQQPAPQRRDGSEIVAEMKNRTKGYARRGGAPVQAPR